MKYKISFIITLWWVLLLVLLGGMLAWLAPKEERISVEENRTLQGAPKITIETILDASFMDGIESYLSYGFFQRSKIIEVSNDIIGLIDFRTLDEALGEGMEAAVEDFIAGEEDEEIKVSKDELDPPKDKQIETTESYENQESQPTPT